MRIGLVGGTGREGRGLAIRWGRAGHDICIGSRDPERAKAMALELSTAGHGKFQGGSNADAASFGEVVLLSIPYTGHTEMLTALKDALQGRIVIDITVPLQPPKVMQVNLPAGQSAALEAQEILGPGVKVVASLHHVSSAHLAELDHEIECDVLTCGDDEEARNTVIGLLKDLGLTGLDAGKLRNSIALESLTPVLLYMNKKYKSADGSGIRITGLPKT